MFRMIAIKALPLTLVLLAGCASNQSSSNSTDTASAGDPVNANTPGFIALENGDNATAIRDLQADNAQMPHSPYDELDLGLAYQRVGRMDKAEPLYRQAMIDGTDTHPTQTTTEWSKGMTVAQIACENLSIGLPPAAPGAASPCQPVMTVAVVGSTTSSTHEVNTYFDVDKATLTPSGKSQIASLARDQANNPSGKISVVGKASLVGSDEHNMDLSHRRADTVRNEMIADGVPAEKIQISWTGDREPVVAEAAGVEEPRNRVVETKF